MDLWVREMNRGRYTTGLCGGLHFSMGRHIDVRKPGSAREPRAKADESRTWPGGDELRKPSHASRVRSQALCPQFR
jgi:hypothetical protein